MSNDGNSHVKGEVVESVNTADYFNGMDENLTQEASTSVMEHHQASAYDHQDRYQHLSGPSSQQQQQQQSKRNTNEDVWMDLMVSQSRQLTNLATHNQTLTQLNVTLHKQVKDLTGQVTSLKRQLTQVPTQQHQEVLDLTRQIELKDQLQHRSPTTRSQEVNELTWEIKQLKQQLENTPTQLKQIANLTSEIEELKYQLTQRSHSQQSEGSSSNKGTIIRDRGIQTGEQAAFVFEECLKPGTQSANRLNIACNDAIARFNFVLDESASTEEKRASKRMRVLAAYEVLYELGFQNNEITPEKITEVKKRISKILGNRKYDSKPSTKAKKREWRSKKKQCTNIPFSLGASSSYDPNVHDDPTFCSMRRDFGSSVGLDSSNEDISIDNSEDPFEHDNPKDPYERDNSSLSDNEFVFDPHNPSNPTEMHVGMILGIALQGTLCYAKLLEKPFRFCTIKGKPSYKAKVNFLLEVDGKLDEEVTEGANTVELQQVIFSGVTIFDGEVIEKEEILRRFQVYQKTRFQQL